MKTIILLLAAALAALPVKATTFTVAITNDAGPGSLRQAIADANATPDTVTITFDAALDGKTILLTSGQLSVSNSLSILGPGADQLTIDGNGSNRVFYLAPGLTNLIAGLTITKGLLPEGSPNRAGSGIYNDHSVLTVSNVTLSSNSALVAGGGIYNDGKNGGSAMLTLQHCTLRDNKAHYGAGINNDGSAGSAVLTLVDCTVSGNSTFAQGGNSTGGAIYNTGKNGGSAPLTLWNCTLSGNGAVIGGGIYNAGAGGSAPLVLQNCTVNTNFGYYGGGIYNDMDGGSGSAPLALTNCTVSGNIGGGIQNEDPTRSTTLTLQDCTVSGNSACEVCSGHSGGGIENWGSIMTLLNCNISGNSSGREASGGGIYHNGAFGFASNCTISGNLAGQYGGGGIKIEGFTGGDMLILLNCTLSGNSARLGWGGGIANQGRGSLALQHCTLTGNSAPSVGGIGVAPGSALTIGHTLLAKGTNGLNFSSSGTVTNLGFNLSDDDSTTNSFAPNAGDLKLGPLANNGGPTFTHALLPGSPAINAGTNAAIAGLPYDQRGPGFPRLVSPAVDIGAFEAPCKSQGDFTRDGMTFLDDFAVLKSNFGISGPVPVAGDLDGDGDVDLVDYSRLRSDFGNANTVCRGPFAPPTGLPTGALCLRFHEDGSAELHNPGGGPVSLDGYSIYAEAGSLDVSGWSSISDQPANLKSNALSAGALTFGEANPTTILLSELNLSGAGTVAAGGTFGLGKPYSGNLANVASAVQFYYTESGTLKAGCVSICLASLTVVNTNDSGPGSLRQALLDICPGGTIDFTNALNSQKIMLTSGQLTVTKNVTILGPGPDQLAIDGDHNGRVFYLGPGQTNIIAGLTLTNGYVISGNGAGIFNDHAVLSVSNVTLSGNSAFAGGGIYNHGLSGGTTLTIQNCTLSGNSASYSGGGIHNNGYAGSAALTIQNSTLSGNSATLYGGGIYNDGSISGSAPLMIQNSTLSGNIANDVAGGIFNYGASGNAPLTIQNCTFSSNSAAQYGGGIYNSGNSGSAPLTVTHTLLAKGTNGLNFLNYFGTVINSGYNLSDDDSTTNDVGIPFATTVANLFLGPLANNGGPAFTHSLLPGSPAINAGNPAFTGLPDFDQRGAAFPRVVGDALDIGAFESAYFNTATSLASAPNPSLFGQPVSFTSTVITLAPGGGTPTGTVEFFDGGISLGIGTVDAAGQATLTTSSLLVGSNSLTAAYSGDSSHLASSGSLGQQVLSLTDPSVFSAGSVDHTSTRFLQTTLMQQLLTVTNVTSEPLAAVRITVHFSEAEKAAKIRVYNASGTNNETGEPYLQHNFPVPPGGQVTFTAEYYSPDRVTVPNPTFTVELLPAQEPLPLPPGTPQPVLRNPARMLAPDSAFLIDFTTVAGARYHILYSSDMVNWSVAQPTVPGTGYVVQWVDNGPPKTRSHPGPEPQRFYQVIKAD